MDSVVVSLTSDNEAFIGFRRAVWSPSGLAPADSCLLATLTHDRRLRVYSVDSGSATLLTSIDQLWKQQCRKQPDLTNYADVRDRAYKLAIIDLVWTDLTEYHGGRCCHLLTVTRSGHVGCWRVGSMAASVELVASFQVTDSLDRVTTLCWLSAGYLLIGRYSGRLHGYQLTVTGDGVSVSDEWSLCTEADRIPVSRVVCTDAASDVIDSTASRDVTLLLAKGFVCVALRCHRKADILVVLNSSFVRLPGGEITGMCRASDGCVMVCTLGNCFFTLSLSGAETTRMSADSFCLKSVPLQLLTETANYACHGLATSPNTSLVCTVEQVSAYYDHLSVREPIRVSFVLLDLPMSTLVNSVLFSNQPLHKLSDLLEAARLCMHVENAPFSGLPADVSSQTPSRQLQCMLFMASASARLEASSGAGADTPGPAAETDADTPAPAAETDADTPGPAAEIGTDTPGSAAETSSGAGTDTPGPAAEIRTDTPGSAAEIGTDTPGSAAEIGTDTPGSAAETSSGAGAGTPGPTAETGDSSPLSSQRTSAEEQDCRADRDGGAKEKSKSQSSRYGETTERLRLQLLRRRMHSTLQQMDDVDSCMQTSAEFRRLASCVSFLQLPQFSAALQLLPSCSVCANRASEMTTLCVTCTAGHRIPLCCQTLYPCSMAPYRRCDQCGAFALSNTLPITGVDLGPWCTFCDGRLITS